MAAPTSSPPIKLPDLPVPHKEFVPYLSSIANATVIDTLKPFQAYESKLREVFAQQPNHDALKDPHINTVPVFAGHEHDLRVRARKLDEETDGQKEKYIMPLSKKDRKPDRSPAVVQSFKDFQTNFNLFSESALVDMDWSNVVAAGSSVVTALLPVPEKYSGSKKAQREYYHQKLAPASDVDLFIYGLNEEEAIKKIKQIETKIMDAILYETTTIRTKNAITIASQYPTRHVQIVLRIYQSVSEILTGFDVDCSCVAYDGKQVYASPRALAAFATQINTVDVSRRSPSYEKRLSKYSHRGFEVYWPLLERSRIDPTIFERSFARTLGLARLLVLEKLPKVTDRESYMDQRREERGRPSIDRSKFGRFLSGNIKDQQDDEIAEWVEEDEVSSYHTFTVPYGEKYHARKIEKLLYTKDLLLNSEWNKPKDREVHLHRHPCFFGYVDDVVEDCCGYCPPPVTEEEQEVAEEESKIYVSGKISFIKDDPGRQAIGSFNPITDDDWTEMAYVGNTARLCQAIVDGDLEHVHDWCQQDGVDVNRRDYTGRTPLHLATISSTLEVVQCLIAHGARLVARLVDGNTALHLAAARGDLGMVKALLEKSEANEEEEAAKEEARKVAKKQEKENNRNTNSSQAMYVGEDGNSDNGEDEDEDMDRGGDSDQDADSVTEGSFVKIKPEESAKGEDMPDDEKEEDSDVYDVNVLAWDSPTSPLHLAIINGRIDMIKLLVSTFGADVLLPVKLLDSNKNARGAILTLALALQLPLEKAKAVTRTLLDLGATSAQADMNQTSALHYAVSHNVLGMLDVFFTYDEPAARSVLDHLSVTGAESNPRMENPLLAAIKIQNESAVEKILSLGAKAAIRFEDFMFSYKRKFDAKKDTEHNIKIFQTSFEQPIEASITYELPATTQKLLEQDVDFNSPTRNGYNVLDNEYHRRYRKGQTNLDLVRQKLRELREYGGEGYPRDPPKDLESDEHYMKDLKETGYQRWSAEMDLLQLKNHHQHELEMYQQSVDRSKDEKLIKDVNEKREAVSSMIKGFERAEKSLLDKGAKTFKELYPDIEDPRDNRGHGWERPKPKPYETKFTFQVSDLTATKKEGYLQLFRAAWDGDIEAIKRLTLATWGEGEYAPLEIAVKDGNNFTPFSIATFRGHYGVARAIASIAGAQYKPKESSGTQERFRAADSDDETDEEEDKLHVNSELVDENFTMDDVAHISKEIKSTVKPLDLLAYNSQSWRFDNSQVEIPGLSFSGLSAGRNSKPSQSRKVELQQWNESLLMTAVRTQDMELLKFILQLGSEFSTRNIGDEAPQEFTIDRSAFQFAIETGRTAMVAEIIKSAGAGIPFNELVKKSGAKEKEKPKYYQGLSIHGKKRTDWAQAGRGVSQQASIEEKHPPLLEAIFKGSLDSTEWFLSDAPMRRYQEFATAHQGDKRVQTLSRSAGGFDKTISSWLGARNDLAVHCAVLSKPTQDSLRLLEHLISVFPASVFKKSREGWTPLHLACSLGRISAIHILLRAGADQTARDNLGRNIVHLIADRHSNQKYDDAVENMRTMLEIVDKRILQDLLIERCAEDPGALTPLARLMKISSHSEFDNKTEALANILLDFGKGEDLDMLSGDGDAPLHAAVKGYRTGWVSLLIARKPEVLYRENATGRTPLEMAGDAYLRHQIDNPPHTQIYNVYSPMLNYGAGSARTVDRGNEDKNYTRVYRICSEAAKTYPGKRKLVSLNDANAVADRLAAKQSNIRKENEQKEKAEDEEAEGFADEVSEWLPQAQLGDVEKP
ncbi:MAG: hypothetical protein M1827_007701 [Pycnora praestabilis]|nr:MAG: hypothetical protein M1827_007701 [Pycnora praestabilis]